jgi:hypothetical protein
MVAPFSGPLIQVFKIMVALLYKAHGRRSDSVIYGCKRIKYDDLVDLTNRHLASRDKSLIHSKSTIQLLSKPRDKRSRQARYHHGSGLFCTRKPPKIGGDDNENTHYQRAQVKPIKEQMFTDKDNAKTSVIISMDDKATLKPGTDIGFKGSRKQTILSSMDKEKAKCLPQHDFSETKVQITPSSFRFMTKKVDDVSDKLVQDDDQSVVMVRPKYYVGSSGSVWASDYIKISHEYPHLYEVTSEDSQWAMSIKKLCVKVKDSVVYFEETSEKEDIERVQKKGGVHKEYEVKRVKALIGGIDDALQTYVSSTKEVPQTQRDNISDYVTEVKSTLECARSVLKKMPSCNGLSILQLYKPLLHKCHSITVLCDNLNLPPLRSIIGEFTDAGPGVGVSNFEVSFRMAELSRLHKTYRRTRLHRSRGDSSQNESERTNGCVGEALVDGGALLWDYSKPFDNKSCEEREAMAIEEINQAEENCMKENAWRVAQEVCERIHMEPGPAGDLMLGMMEDDVSNQFFYNTKELTAYQKTAKSKRRSLPGYYYLKKVEDFIGDHIEKGELYLEYRLGSCTKDKMYDVCDFCKKCPLLDTCQKSSKPYPDYTQLPKYKYLSLESTPMQNRDIDDFLPRANLKKLFNSGEMENSNTAMKVFCDKFIVKEEHAVAYIKHLELLDLKKRKRAEQRKRTNTKNTARFVKEPNTSQVESSDDEEESSDDASESSDHEEEVILAVVGDSDSEVELDTACAPTTKTRLGRQCTTYRSRHFYGDSD